MMGKDDVYDDGEHNILFVETSGFDREQLFNFEDVMTSESWVKVEGLGCVWYKKTEEDKGSLLDNLSTEFHDQDLVGMRCVIQKGPFEPYSYQIS